MTNKGYSDLLPLPNFHKKKFPYAIIKSKSYLGLIDTSNMVTHKLCEINDMQLYSADKRMTFMHLGGQQLSVVMTLWFEGNTFLLEYLLTDEFMT